MGYFNLEHINKEITTLAKKINAPAELLPMIDPQSGNQVTKVTVPIIATDEKGYHYIFKEGMAELEHRITKELNELYYWIFCDITANMAFDYEKNSGHESRDYRRCLHEKQMELLKCIDAGFFNRRKTEISKILKKSPYDDGK